jgi:copper transport protein
VVRALLIALAALAIGAPAAQAHATLQASSPQRGAALTEAPRQVVLTFDEPVEGSFGSVRVFDARARRVDDGHVVHPGGAGTRIAVGIEPGLADGSYTATYRVVSADGHPVSGGLLFTVGAAGAAPGESVSELIDAAEAGPVTGVALGAVKAAGYLAIALALGGLLFIALVWGPAARAASVEPGARAGFARRARRMLTAAVALGATSTAAGIVLEGATVAGTSFWGALNGAVLGGVIGTRFGEMWAVRLGIWLLLGGGLAVAALRRVAVPALAPQPRTAVVTAGGGGGAPARGPGRAAPTTGGGPGTPATAALVVAGCGLALTPALSGHARSQSPAALLVPADVIHVVAMSAWLGGLAFLLAAVPAATRGLAPAERTRLLAATLARFSPLALVSVLALAATGTLQAIFEVRTLSALTGTAFGRAVLIKALLLLALIALGAVNRRRVVPALRRLAAGGAAPGDAGRLLRRTLRAEVGLIVAVLAVTGALTGYPPPTAEATGPVSVSRQMGPLDLELTVDPARVGANQVHLYLFRSADGTPFTGTKELRVRATLPERGIGPIELSVRQAGPGHYVAPAAMLSPAGDWELVVADRVSDFDEYTTTVKARVR